MSAEEIIAGDPLVSQSQINRWEREYATLGEQIQKIEDRRLIIKTMIDAARALSPANPPPQAASRSISKKVHRSGGRRKRQISKPRSRDRHIAKKDEIPTTPSSKPQVTAYFMPAPDVSAIIPRRRGPESEWKPIIRMIVETAPAQPVSYSDAKTEILKSDLAEKFKQSDKGFYNAISRLAKAGEIVSYKGHLFAPAAFQKFKEDFAAGLVRDLKIENSAHRSPMGEATLNILSQRKAGAESGHLIWELRKNQEFAAAIDKNKTHPYNVFARLVKTGEIIKRGKRYYHPRSEREAPSDPEGAPISSESRDAAQGSFLG